MKTTGQVRDILTDRKTGKLVLSLIIDTTSAELEEITAETVLDVTLTKHREKRSRDANAFAWVLIHKLAAKLHEPPEDIYRAMIRQLGGVSEIVSARKDAVAKLVEGWSRNGLGWFAEVIELPAKPYNNVVLYYGSSVYDSEQMGRLIEAIVQECKAQNIDTATPAERALLLEKWGGRTK